MTMDIFNGIQEGIRGKLPTGKVDTPGKITQKVECPEQKNGKRKPLLPEKALKIGKNVEKTVSLHTLYKFST